MTKCEINAPNQIPHPSGVVVMPHISNVAVCQIPASAAKEERQIARRGGGMCKFRIDRHINRAFPVSSENDAAFSTLAAISPCSAEDPCLPWMALMNRRQKEATAARTSSFTSLKNTALACVGVASLLLLLFFFCVTNFLLRLSLPCANLAVIIQFMNQLKNDF